MSNDGFCVIEVSTKQGYYNACSMDSYHRWQREKRLAGLREDRFVEYFATMAQAREYMEANDLPLA